MALYILVPVLLLLLLIRFTHHKASVFYIDGLKVSCEKEALHGHYWISYRYGHKQHKVHYRTKLTRDRAYLSLTSDKVRKVLIHA